MSGRIGYLANIIRWDRRELKQYEDRLLSIDRKSGRRAITNAHKATHNKLRDAAIRNARSIPYKRSRSRGSVAMAKLDRFSGARQQAGKSKGNTKPFRKGVVQKANYQFKASFTKNGVVSRSWVSSKFYNRFIGHFFEQGFIPGGNGRRVPATHWRFGPARRPNAALKFESRVLKALTAQLDAGRTMTAGELERVI